MVLFESLIGASIPVAINTISAGLISAVGFTTGGVAAGSIAAGVQAGLGVVAQGSMFAGLQSMGALGVGILGSTVAPIAIGGAVLVPYFIKTFVRNDIYVLYTHYY
jgi:hypothetical protein